MAAICPCDRGQLALPVQAIVTSGQLGVAKPDPEFFERVAEFAAAVAVLSAGAVAAGAALHPQPPAGAAEHGGMSMAMAARGLAVDQDGLVLDVLGSGAATSRMLEVRGPLIARGEFPAQMKLELFMKDLHLIQDAARAVGAPLPLTDVAERLYAAVNAEGHGGEDLAVVVRALDAMTGANR